MFLWFQKAIEFNNAVQAVYNPRPIVTTRKHIKQMSSSLGSISDKNSTLELRYSDDFFRTQTNLKKMLVIYTHRLNHNAALHITLCMSYIYLQVVRLTA